MKRKEAYALQPDNQVHHARYGYCNVVEIIPDFGVVVQPEHPMGQRRLAVESGAALGTPLLEDDPRELRYLPAAPPLLHLREQAEE